MSRHEVTIGDASVTFEQVEVELDYNDILLNIEDTISERITDQINDEAWDAVSVQVEDCVSEHHDTSSEDAVSDEVHSVLVGYRLAPPDEQGPVECGAEVTGCAYHRAGRNGCRLVGVCRGSERTVGC